MASLKEAKQNLKKVSKEPNSLDSLDQSKLKLLKLDIELSLPKIANEIDTLEYKKVLTSLFTWTAQSVVKSKSISTLAPYIPLILSILLVRKNK